MAKPRATPQSVEPGPGVVVVEPGRETDFLHPLPVRALWGVGPATHEKLDNVGVKTVGELAALDDSIVVAMLGNATGRHLHRLAHGLDERPVEPHRDAKSIGHEETFVADIFDIDVLHSHLVRLADAVAARVRSTEMVARTLTLKIKFANFRSITRTVTLESPRASGPGFTEALAPLLAEIDPSPGVRLLGVSASQFVAADAPRPPVQASLFDDPAHGESSSEDREAVWSSAGSAIDDIRARFGRDAIRTGGTLAHGTDVGENPWGPPAPESS
jgi:DNA polymerase-4